MELFVQFGYGMMDLTKKLVSSWRGGTAILSPRDLEPKQAATVSESINFEGGKVLLDPQFYMPHADHGRLTAWDYWPNEYQTTDFWEGAELRALLEKIVSFNGKFGCEQIILPGLYASRVDDAWTARQEQTIEEARRLTKAPLLATVALSSDAMRATEDIDEVLAAAERWDVAGIYLVCEHPNGDYLVGDPMWLAHQLDLVAGLRLKKKDVVVGYANHQQLVLACAGANALASGTWMNVRSFPPDKFNERMDEERKQKAIWYYCPQALSEYKVPFLDIARTMGVLDRLAPPTSMAATAGSILFSGPQPTSINWTERDAFRHYLECLAIQAEAATGTSYEETTSKVTQLLRDAEALLGDLHGAGVRGQMRDFRDRECLDACRAALAVLESTRGPTLRRAWSSLHGGG